MVIIAARIQNCIKGYLVIKVEGINPERFINIAIARDICLWNVSRVDFIALKACISLKDYRYLYRIRKKTDFRVSILEKRGCPFLLHRIFRRKALIAGGIAAVLIMYFLTSFVWVVEIRGNERVSAERVLERLEAFGIKSGTFKYLIDTKDIETKLLIDMDQLIWVGINILGIKAIVDIVERVEPPSLIDKSIPCNIVAKKDGIIVDIYVFEGREAVKSGDTVQAGQVLITGIIEEPGKPARTVHAMGRVEARIWYKLVEEQPLRIVTRERTGRSAKRTFLKVGPKVLRLNRKDCGFLHYDTVTDAKNTIGWRNIMPPIELIIEKYYEVTVVNEYISAEAAVELAIEKAATKLTGILPQETDITDMKVRLLNTEPGSVRVDIIFETLEDIGMEEGIDINKRED